jgi:tungstate transport system substrate-binding protein
MQGQYRRILFGCLGGLVLPFALGWLSAACVSVRQSLTLATTTSVANSGLLDLLLGAYERETHVTARAHLVGSGRALAMLAADEVDAAITHAPAAEEVALRDRPTWRYTKVMFNDFVLAGPAADPARVRGAKTAAEAMARVAAAGVRFISRGDASGTHERELALWRQAGTQPAGSLLVVAGAGMGTTLRIASETAAYTLTDRATFMQHRTKLAVLFEGDSSLLNSYAVTFDAAGASAREAERFASWLADGSGRAVIEQFRVGAEQVRAFRTWPLHHARSRPSDLPR